MNLSSVLALIDCSKKLHHNNNNLNQSSNIYIIVDLFSVGIIMQPLIHSVLLESNLKIAFCSSSVSQIVATSNLELRLAQ